MKTLIAIPTVNGELATHFGHCEKFAIIEIDENQVMKVEYLIPPQHEPGVYPQFLAENGIKVIIVGGIGQRAQNLFAQQKIEVYVGVNSGSPEKLVEDYLNKQLQTGQNLCDH